MTSLTGLMQLTSQALQADQAALNATANNVANQNTVGYTKQVVSFSDGDTVLVGSSNTATTTIGPTATATSLRDRVLDQRVQQQTQLQAGTSSEAAVLSQMEGVFSITGSSTTAGSTQIGTALNGFFSSLTALSGNPSDGATQQSVLSAAQTLANAFNSAASGLFGVQQSVSSNIATSVPQVNSLTSSIASLNKQIQALSPNQDAGSLEDQRQQDITKLSGLIGLDQITTEKNGMTLTTTGGTVLVAGNTSYALSTAPVAFGMQIYDATGTNVTAGITGGSIGGQLTAQGVDLPTGMNALDALAYRIGNAVNAQNAAGLTTAGITGGNLFNVTPSQAGAAAGLSVVATSSSAIAAAGIGEGPTGNTNANALANLVSLPDATGLTINGNLAGMISQIGSASSTLQSESTSQQGALTQLTTLQSTLSGVNLDTEAADLTQYQRSYQAAAQVLTIIDHLLATAMNLGQQTTVQ
jgi:flagellar hook-associated protein 1 FlgK